MGRGAGWDGWGEGLGRDALGQSPASKPQNVPTGELLELQNDQKQTALHIAAEKGYFDICKLLCEYYDAEIDIANDFKKT